jgi:hypothetical protein
MVLTAEEKKEKKKQASKKYREENKEKIKQASKKYQEENKEELAQKRKEYREINKEKIAQRIKEYRENNPEAIKQKYIKRRSNIENVEKENERAKIHGKTKKGRISRWKNGGIIPNEDTYEKFEEARHCESCNVKFEKIKNGNRKCLDHHHASGHVRSIICDNCNIKKGVVDNNIRIVLLELTRYFFRNIYN